MSQTTLGDKLNVTFQQIHKYESGTCRVPASQLSHIADALDVPVGYFYGQDAAAGADAAPFAGNVMPLTQRHAVELLECFEAMKAPQRSALLEIAKVLAAANAPHHSHQDDRSP